MIIYLTSNNFLILSITLFQSPIFFCLKSLILSYHIVLFELIPHLKSGSKGSITQVFLPKVAEM